MQKLLVTLAVSVILLFGTTVFAQTDIGLYGIGARLGFVMPENEIDSTIGIGLNADLGTIMPNLALHAYLDYWSSGEEEDNYEYSWSAIGISAIAKYMFAMEGSIKPYAGGGLGLEFANFSAEYDGPGNEFFDGDFDESETDLGIHLVGGASMMVNEKMTGFAEVKYTIGEIDYFGIFAGIMYSLGE